MDIHSSTVSDNKLELDFSQCRLPPFQHQREDVAALLEHSYLFITNEMRTGKTKTVIDAAQFLFKQGKIDRVIVLAPAPVRDVWSDRKLGELAKHLWENLPCSITECHARIRTWYHGSKDAKKRLDWLVSNYEFVGFGLNVKLLLDICNKRTLLVLDESSYIKNHSASRTKACVKLRAKCGRVVLLNGTPIFHSPLDLYSQGNLLHPSILECPGITRFKARYAIQAPVRGPGGKPLTSQWGPVMKIEGWTNLEDLQRRFAPITIRRLQKDCLDLPPKLDPVVLTATLTPHTWRAYTEMRDEMVVWLNENQVAMSATAAIKVLRLSQITSGFLSGIEEESFGDSETPGQVPTTKEIGHEKLDVLLWFLTTRLEEDPNLKVVVWHRFRAECERTMKAVREQFPLFTVSTLYGGQTREERQYAISLLHPDTSPSGPVLVAGTAGTGSFGLDFSAAHTCITMSSGYSSGQMAQMLDRVYGPGQKYPIAYYDIVAVGPKGQHTIDHAIIEARQSGQDIATWTSAAWVHALLDEDE